MRDLHLAYASFVVLGFTSHNMPIVNLTFSFLAFLMRYWSKYAEAKALVLQELCPPGAGAADGDVSEGGWHVVAPGDTLWGIARLHRTSVAALLRANPALAADPDRISPGTRVRLPPP